jgi:hypothetical protein
MFFTKRIEELRDDKFGGKDAKMPPQYLIRKLIVSKGIVTHVERRTFLHGKKVSNNNLVVPNNVSECIKQRFSMILSVLSI